MTFTQPAKSWGKEYSRFLFRTVGIICSKWSMNSPLMVLIMQKQSTRAKRLISMYFASFKNLGAVGYVHKRCSSSCIRGLFPWNPRCRTKTSFSFPSNSILQHVAAHISLFCSVITQPSHIESSRKKNTTQFAFEFWSMLMSNIGCNVDKWACHFHIFSTWCNMCPIGP